MKDNIITFLMFGAFGVLVALGFAWGIIWTL